MKDLHEGVLEEFADRQVVETLRYMYVEEIYFRAKLRVMTSNEGGQDKKVAKKRYLAKLKRSAARYFLHLAADRARPRRSNALRAERRRLAREARVGVTT